MLVKTRRKSSSHKSAIRRSDSCSFARCKPYRSFRRGVLRLRPVLIRASRVLPSMPPLFQSVERHFFEGQFGGFSDSGIHLCPHTSHTATLIVVQPMQPLYSILSFGHFILD